MNYLSPSFTLSLCLFCYRPLHFYWQVYILNLNCRYLYPPWFFLEVNNLLALCIYFYGNIILCYYILRRDIHCNNAEAYLYELINYWPDDDKAGTFYRDDPSESKYNTSFILSQYLYCT